MLWANLHLLFWLSLIPFVTAWMGENHFAAWPVALYGVVLLMAAVAYFILTRALIALHGDRLGPRRGRRRATSRAGSRSSCTRSRSPSPSCIRWLAGAIYVAVAIMWLIPDRRIEKAMTS